MEESPVLTVLVKILQLFLSDKMEHDPSVKKYKSLFHILKVTQRRQLPKMIQQELRSEGKSLSASTIKRAMYAFPILLVIGPTPFIASVNSKRKKGYALCTGANALDYYHCKKTKKANWWWQLVDFYVTEKHFHREIRLQAKSGIQNSQAEIVENLIHQLLSIHSMNDAISQVLAPTKKKFEFWMRLWCVCEARKDLVNIDVAESESKSDHSEESIGMYLN
jgi:hypothetical protein